MATRSDSLSIWLARALATYSLPIYVIGLLVIVFTRIAEGRLGVALPGRLQQALVVGTLLVMVATYLAERRFRGEQDGTGSGEGETAEGKAEYSLYARLSMAGAAVGVAIGIYVAFAMERPLAGVLFVLGAYLFVRMGYRHEEQHDET